MDKFVQEDIINKINPFKIETFINVLNLIYVIIYIINLFCYVIVSIKKKVI